MRATVWRRLKGLGAIYLQNSAAALPAGPAADRALRLLRREILDMSGTASLLACSVLAGEAEIRAAFQAARDEEYAEIIDKCHDFVAGIRKEFRAEHFTYAELEENDEDLIKLRNRFAKITARDVFGAQGRRGCEEALAVCERELEGYGNWVYAGESTAPDREPEGFPGRARSVVDGSAAIINHSEVAILGVGRVLPRPWVVDGDRCHAGG